jgi:hypothetical protein
VMGRGILVRIGPVTIDGTRAHLDMSATCGGLCGLGERLVLFCDTAGVWTVTGTDGPGWIS